MELTAEFFHAVLDQSGDATVIFDGAFRYLYVNSLAVRSIGKTAEEVMGKALTEVFPATVSSSVYMSLCRARDTRVPQRCQMPSLLRADSWNEIYIEPLSFPADHPAHAALLVRWRDVTAQQEAERKQLAERERFAVAMDLSGIGTWEYEIQTGVLRTSANTDRLFGISDRVTGAENSVEPYFARIHPDDRSRIAAAWESGITPGRKVEMECRILLADGSLRWVAARGNALSDGEGNVRYVVGALFDITERKQAEYMREERESQWRALFENAREAIGIASEGRILYVNPAYARLLGYSTPEEMIGMTIGDTVAPSDLPRLNDMSRRRAQGEALPDLYSYRGRKRDGEEIDLENYVSTYMLDGVRYTVVTTRDITERLRALREIQDLNSRLQQAMTETHHRVKNNLQIVSSLLELASMNGSDMVPRSEILRLTQHLRSLAVIHDLMTAETKRNGNINDLSARDILERLLLALRTALGLEERLTFSAEDARLTGRQATSFALITNELVTNAVKHGATHVEIRFDVYPEEARLTVRDNGPGFPQDFDPTHAGHIGLELVHNLTQWDLRGTILFEAVPEGGGQAILCIPAAR